MFRSLPICAMSSCPPSRKGFGTWLAEYAIGHPDVATVKRWMLSTSDAHGLYAKLGFQPLRHPDRYMQIIR